MHKYLTNMLQCPVCHGELKWTIKSEDEHRILEGEACCAHCGALYPVKDEIAVFLTPELPRNDLWEQGSYELTNYFKENPEKEEELMKTPMEKLAPADKFVRGMYLEEKKKYSDSRSVLKEAFNGIYTKEYNNCWNSEMEYICSLIAPEDGPIVDLAVGRGYLVERMAGKLSNYIIAADFSQAILRRNKLVFKELGIYDKISLIAFDARLTPFKDNSVGVMTSNLGLVNIEQPGELIKELRRVVSGKIMAVTNFFDENDEENGKLLYKYGIDKLAFRKNAVENFEKCGWKISIENDKFGLAKPTPTGIIIDGLSIDALPVTDTEIEWCVLVGK